MAAAPAPAVLHRAAPGQDIYFVANGATGPIKGALRFRIADRVPEL